MRDDAAPRRLLHEPRVATGLVMVLVVTLLAVAGPFLAPFEEDEPFHLSALPIVPFPPIHVWCAK